MKLQGTLRRTLAMLLVLIFALSNMGLAEMAEQVVESIPAVDPSIEEPAVEEAAPEETDETGDVEDVPEGEEPGAPDESAQEPEAEPEAEAVRVAVEVVQIDETSLCAYETIEPEGAYEVSYIWERATSADGEWEALEETSDVYSTDAEDRYDYVYRCTAVVGDVTATSEPVAFGGVEFVDEAPAEEPEEEAPALIASEADLGLLPINELGEVTVKADGSNSGKDFIIYNKDHPDSLVLSVETVSDAESYTWTTGGAADDQYVTVVQDAEDQTKATVTIKNNAPALNKADGTTVTIQCTASDGKTEKQGSMPITLLPTLTEDDIKAAFRIVKGAADDTAVTELAQPISNDTEEAAIAKMVGISSKYPVAWSTEDSAWIAVAADEGNGTIGNITVNKLDDSGEANQFKNVDGQTVSVKAKVQVGAKGQEIEVAKTITLLPSVGKVSLLLDGEDASAGASSPIECAMYDKVSLTAKLAPAENAAAEDIAENIRVIGDVQWKVTTSDSGEGDYEDSYTGEKTEKGNDFSFIPTPAAEEAAPIYYQVTATAGEAEAAVCKFHALLLPTDVTIDTTDNSGKKITLSDDQKTATQTIFLGGEEAPVALTLKLDGTEDNIYKKTIHWEVTNNTHGVGGEAAPFLTWTEPTYGDGKIADGTTSITFKAPTASIKTGTGNNPVTFTVTGKRMPKEGEVGAQDFGPLVFKINILEKLDSANFDGDKDIAFSVDEIGQPAKTYDGTAPAYATATASITNETLKPYPVTWTVDAEGDGTAGNYVSIAEGTNIITAKAKTATSSPNTTWNAADKTKGKEIKIKATITLGSGKTVESTKAIVVRPAPEGVAFSQADGTAISGALTVAADTERLVLNVRPTLTGMTPSDVTPYATTWKATYTPDKEANGESGTSHDIDVGADNSVSLDISRAGTITLVVKAMKGTETVAEGTQIIKVQAQPKSVTVEKTSDTTTIYPGSDITFDVTGKIDEQTQATWFGNLVWTLSGTNMNNQFDPSLYYAAQQESAKAYLEGTGPNSTHVTLHVPNALNTKIAASGAKLTVRIVFQNTDLDPQEITFNVKNRPGEGLNLATAKQLVINAYQKISATVSETGDKNFVAQGDETAKAVFTPAEGTKDKFDAAAAGYTLQWSVTDDKDKTDDVSEWLSIDQTGAISVREEHNKADSTDKANKIGDVNAGKTFKIKYALEGVETLTGSFGDNLKAEANLVVVPAPAGVKIDVEKTKEQEKTKPYSAIPAVLPSGADINLIAELTPVQDGITAGPAPELTAASSNSYFTFAYPAKAEDGTQDTTYKILTSKPKDSGSYEVVTVTATSWNGKTAEQKIIITGETINLEEKDGKQCGKSDNHTHFWKTIKSSSAEGHVYECANAECTATSKPVKHDTFQIVYEEKHTSAEEDKVLWKKDSMSDIQGIAKIKCPICQFECTHADYQVKGKDENYGKATYVDGTHHVSVCPTCGLEIKQAHVDNDGNNECDLCGGSSAETRFTPPEKMLIVGEEFTPTLDITEAQEWEATYSVAAADQQYLTLLDPATGKVRAEKATEDGKPVVLSVDIQAITEGTARPVKGSMKITVKNKAESISITSEDGTDYVIANQTESEGHYLHLTAEISPNAKQTDLTGYHWAIDTAGLQKVKFYEKDATSGKLTEITGSWSVGGATNAKFETLDIYVKATSTAKGTAADADHKKAIVKFVKNDAADGEAEGKFEIEVLPELTTALLTPMITFNNQKPNGEKDTGILTNDKKLSDGTKIIQGTSMALSLNDWVKDDEDNDVAKPFDTRYGTNIAFKVEVVSEGDSVSDSKTVQAADIARWISIGDKTANPTIISAADSSDLNALDTTNKGAAFKVTATVTHDWNTDGTSEKAKTEASRYIWVINKGNTAKFQYKNGADWTDIPAEGLTVDEGDEINVRLLEVTDKTTEAINAANIVWDKIDAKNGEFKDEAKNEDGTAKYEENGYKAETTNVERVFVVAADGASDSFTIGAAYPGMTITPAKINVKRLIHEITLDCPITEVGAGEQEKNGSLSKPKTISIRATVDQPESRDTLHWELYAKDGTTKIPDLTLVQDKTDKNLYTISLAAGKRDVNETLLQQIGPEVVVTVWAEKSTDKDGKQLKQTHTIKIYQTPGADDTTTEANGLEIITEKTDPTATIENKRKLTLTVGESTKITNAGWIKDSIWGSSPDAPVSAPVVKSTPKDEADAGSDVITIENGVITAKTIGTATITINPYNIETEPNAKETLNVSVTAAVDTVELAANAKLEDSYEISVNQPSADRVKIAKKGTFEAYRNITDDRTGSTNKVKADDAAVTLVSDDESTLQIVTSEDGASWELLGIKPGTAHIYGYVNENAKSTPAIPVVVTAAAQKILFKQGDAALPENAQIIGDLEKKTPIVLTAVTEPEGSTGKITISVDNLDAVESALDEAGTTVTLTPKAAGKVVVTAKTSNANWKGPANTLLDPEYLVARVEILLGAETSGEEPGPGGITTTTGVKIVDKQAIGPDEITHVAATGVEGKTVTWSAEPAAAVTLTPNAEDHSVAVAPAATGKAVISATVDGTVIGSATVYLLTAPTDIVFDRANPLRMSVGEVLDLNADVEGYNFTAEVASEANGIERITDDLFTFVSSNPAVLSISNENGQFRAKAVKKTSKKVVASLTISAKGCEKSLTVPVEITAKNKSFKIDVNGSTLYVAPGQQKPIVVTSNPKNTPANLVYLIDGEDGTFINDMPGVMSFEATGTGAMLEIDEAAPEGTYPVTVKAEGFTDHADQSFTVVIQPEAAEGSKPAIAVRKIGVNGIGYDEDATGSVTVVKNEKLQAYFLVDGAPVAGTVVWTPQSKADKNKAAIDAQGLITVKAAKGSVVINGSVNGIPAEPITLNFAPAPKVELVPNVTTRTVAVGEEFQMGLSMAYPDAKANETYTVSWTDDLGAERVPDTDDEVKNLWTFGKPGMTTATLTPVWGGKSKQVKFTVLEQAATEFEVPDEVFVSANSKTYVHAEMEGYANLTWLAGTTEILAKDVPLTADKSIKAKKIANDEILITATNKAVGPATLIVKGPGAEDGKEIAINVKAADTQFPEGTVVTFDKKVITVGESTTVRLATESGETVIPSGTVTYKFQSVKGAGGASVKGDVVKGTKPGEVIVTATLGTGKAAPKIEGKLYVVERAKIRAAVNPTKMGAYEKLDIDVTITNYDAKHVLIPDYQDEISTEGMLTAESNSSLITASVAQQEGDAPNKYTLTLQAGPAVKNNNGKYASAKVTLRLSNGQKKTMSIQVVEPAFFEEVYVPDSITLAVGTNVKLVPAIAQGAAYAGNYNWHFADEASAKLADDHLLTLEDGKLTVDRKGTPTGTDEIIYVAGSYQDEELKTIAVTIAAAKAGKDQFKLVKPNRDTVYIGEKFMGKIEFNPGVGGGSVTWKSSKGKIITVDKATGLYTVVGPAGKFSDVSASVNGKNSSLAKQRLNVAAAPSELAFDVADITLVVGAKEDLHKHVRIDRAAALSGKDYSSALTYTADNNSAVQIDNETGELVALAEGSAIVTAVTYNGLSANMLVVVGQGGSSTPTDPTDKTAASIELFIDSQPLNGQTVTLTEGKEGFKPEVVVKNASGTVIDVPVTWNNPDAERVTIAADGTVTPLSYTQENLTVTASVAGTDATASYTLKIEADPLKEDNFKLEIKRDDETVTSLLVKDGTDSGSKFPNVTASLILDVPNVQLGSMVEVSSITMKSLTKNLLTIADETGGKKNEFKFAAVKAGTAQVEISFNLIGGTQQKITRTIYIDELPSPDDISIVDAEGKPITSVKLGQGEKGEFHISLGSGFKGTPSEKDLSIAAWATPKDKDLTKQSDNTKVSVEKDTKDPLKYTFCSADAYVPGKFTIEVEAYAQRLGDAPKDEERIKASFEVEIAKAPAKEDFEITGTPTLTSDNKLTLGAGESVTIKAPMKKDATGFWSQGFEWVDATKYTTGTADADKASVVKGSSDNEITVTYGKKTADGTPIKMELRCVGKTGGNALATVELTYKAVPTNSPTPNYSDAKLQDKENKYLTGSTTVEIGENESMTAYVKFGSADTDGYSTNLRWDVDSAFVTVKPDGASCEFTGAASTGDSTVTAKVYYGAGTDILLGTFKIKVLPAPTKADLVLKTGPDGNYTTNFTNTLDRSKAKNDVTAVEVAVVLTGKSAALDLKCTNPGVVIKPVTGKKNVWKIYWSNDGDTEANPQVKPSEDQKTASNATLILSSPANNIYKNINLTLTGRDGA